MLPHLGSSGVGPEDGAEPALARRVPEETQHTHSVKILLHRCSKLEMTFDDFMFLMLPPETVVSLAGVII